MNETSDAKGPGSSDPTWCPYCGAPIEPRQAACRAHSDLPRLDPIRQLRLPLVADAEAAGGR